MDGRGNSHNVKAGFFQICRIRRERDVTVCETLCRDFFGRILPIPHHFNTPFVDVKADDLKMLGKRQGNGESDISESDHGHGGVFGQKLFMKIHGDGMRVMLWLSSW